MPALTLYTIFLYYVVFEGAFRKWIFPAATNELFLLKDVILFAALFCLWISQRAGIKTYYHFNPTETAIWQIWVGIACAGLAISGFSLSGFAGFRYYIAALPILVLQAYYTPSTVEIREFFARYMLVCLGVCLLGFAQFASPPDAAINSYAWSPSSEMDVATFGEVSERASFGRTSLVRITGTFSYIAPYAAYLQFMFFVCLGMLLVTNSDRSRLFYAGCLLLVIANMLMTGSRAPVFISMLLATLFLPDFARTLRGQSIYLNAAVGLVAIVFGLWLLTDLIGALAERHTIAQDAGDRMSGAFFMPIYTVMRSPWIGDGVGATFLGMGQLTGTGISQFKFDEVFQDRLGVDVGVFGYLFFLAFKIYFLFATYSLVRRARTADIRIWALVSFAYQASWIWTVPIYNAVACVFYFISIALFAVLRSANGPVIARAMRYPVHVRAK